MVTYPVYVRRNSYRGADPRKKAKAQQENLDASILEATANRLIQAQTRGIKSYLWAEISRESGLAYDTVKRLGFSIDGGSNGFTATRPGLTEEEYEHAMKGLE